MSALRLAAVGDLSFEGARADRPDAACLADVAHVLHGATLGIGNLECVLTHGGSPVPGKCTLRGAPAWAAELKRAGIGLVSLANNHAMDYGPDGLASTRDALRQAGIHAVGAGRHLHEARAPYMLDLAGRRVTFLARTSVPVSSPSSATAARPGVAWLDEKETMSAIADCRREADVVVLLLHAGLEEYRYPSPGQRAQTRRFVDAGADVIFGCHPHVVQGVERHGPAVVAHSLGNFVFSEFDWSYEGRDGQVVTERATLSDANRQGMIATVEWDVTTTPAVHLTLTRIENGVVRRDAEPKRALEVATLTAAMARGGYAAWWPAYAMGREWDLRLRAHVAPALIIGNLHRVRFRHLKEVVGLMRRSSRLVSESSTNPYE